MRTRILLLVLIVCNSFSLFAQVKKTTYYYDSDWKGVADSTLATYKRYIIIPEDTMFRKQVRDYYITGELQGEGSFISIDKYDDSKSVFDGKCITYFKNGKKSYERTYKNGLLEGEFTTYYENGVVKLRSFFVNGKLHGEQKYFSEDGGTCIVEEYDMDNKTKPYYTAYYSNGTSARFNYSDDKPYYDQPRIRDEIFSNGTHIVRANNLEIRVKEIYDNAWFDHFVLLVNVINNSGNAITFDPNETQLALFKKGLSYDNGFQAYSALSGFEVEKYIIDRKQSVAGIMGAINAFQSGYAGNTTSNTTTNGTVNYSGNSQVRAFAYGSGGYASGFANGNYSGNANFQSQTTTRTYNSTEAFQAKMLAQQQLQATYDQIPNSARQFTEGYINRCSIRPGEYASGQYWVPCDGKISKNRSYILVIPIEGIRYYFSLRFRDGSDASGQTEYIRYTQ